MLVACLYLCLNMAPEKKIQDKEKTEVNKDDIHCTAWKILIFGHLILCLPSLLRGNDQRTELYNSTSNKLFGKTIPK